jgi:hypothetical protein
MRAENNSPEQQQPLPKNYVFWGERSLECMDTPMKKMGGYIQQKALYKING